MKKRGFTLVELLAVIAILSLLVIMTLPAVLRLYKQSRVTTFQNEIKGAFRTAENQFISDSMSLNAGGKIVYTNGCNSVNGATVKTLEITGDSNFKYYIEIDVDGKIKSIKASNGTYSYIRTGSDLKIDEIDVEFGNGATLDSSIVDNICSATSSNSENGSGNENESAITYVDRQVEGAITVGDEVAIDSEHFYVISSNSTNTVLLAKYNLLVGEIYGANQYGNNWMFVDTYTSSNSGYGLQNSNTIKTYNSRNGIVAFSGNGYWDNSNCSIDRGDANETLCSATAGLKSEYANSSNIAGSTTYVTTYPYVYKSNMSSTAPQYTTYDDPWRAAQNNGYTIIYYVEEYINTLKGLGAPSTIVGRLLSYEEATSLSNDILGTNLSYWLGSAKSDREIWYVDSSSGKKFFSSLCWQNYNNGVRPVIEVPTSTFE